MTKIPPKPSKITKIPLDPKKNDENALINPKKKKKKITEGP